MKQFLVTLFVILFVTTPVGAQQDPMEARGFAADKVYDFHDVDSVNTFNGNLMIHLPIGPGFRFNGKVGFGLTLFYNSTSWHYELRAPLSDGGGPMPGENPDDPMPVGGPYPRDSADPQEWRNNPPTVIARPVARANAGFGWYLSPGRLWGANDPLREQQVGFYTYEAPDGSDHTFYHRVSDDPRTLRTADNSYLRLRIIDGTIETTTAGNVTITKIVGASQIHVDFPDGTYQVFLRYDRPAVAESVYNGDWTVAPSQSSSKLWRLYETRDYYGNAIHFKYSSTPVHKEIWDVSTINDGFPTPRTIAKAYFRYPPPDPLNDQEEGWVETVLDEIHLAAFGSSQLNAQYVFHTTPRDMAPGEGGTTDHDHPYKVPILTSIDLPDGSSYGFDTSVGPGDIAFPGCISQLRLPTGGRIDYDWVQRDELPGTTGPRRPMAGSTIAVWHRTVTDPAAAPSQQQAKWSYGWAYSTDMCTCTSGGSSYPCMLARQMTTSVTRPDGNTEFTYYSVYRPSGQTGPGCTANDWSRSEFGLPITHYASDPSSSNRLLSGDLRRGAILLPETEGTVWDGRGAYSSSTYPPTQSKYAQYEWDSGWAVPGLRAPNSRIRSSSIRWNSSPVRYTASSNHAFDGFGHYRLNVSSGNVASATGADVETKTTFRGYPGSLTQNLWFLDMPAEECTSYGAPADPETTSSCSQLAAPLTSKNKWETSTSFLAGKRILKSGSVESGEDLLALFSYDRGNLASKTFYGGDNTATPGSHPHGAGSGFTPSGTPAYTLTYTNQLDSGNGAVKNIKAVYSGFNFSVKDIDYDVTTGMVSAARDTARLQTTYQYDLLGRLKSVAPPGASATSYAYTLASTGQTFVPATVVAETPTATGGFVKKQFEYDGLGRLWREKEFIDATRVSTRETLYDPLGRIRKRSELQPVPTNYTETTWDELGRPTRVQSSDGQHETSIAYSEGPRTLRRTFTVRTGESETPATTTETSDSFGRLAGVVDPVGTTGSYVYDAADRLISATVNGQQSRIFEYDGRGLLTSETYPELITETQSGLLVSKFAYKYDARGHVLERNLLVNDVAKVNSIFNLRYTYDSAERMKTLSAWNPDTGAPQYRLIKEMWYADANVPDFAMGKLRTATRHNYQPALGGDIQVSETYTYGDNAGRMTDRTTTVVKAGPPMETIQSFTQGVTYTDLSAVDTMSYPVCNTVSCGARPWPQDKLFRRYINGRLHSIYTNQDQPDDFVSQILHADNGAVGAIHHGNGVVDVMTQDPKGIPRPQRITFQGYCAGPAIAINEPADKTIAAGTTASLSVTPPLGVASPTYAWYQIVNGVPALIPNSNSHQLTTGTISSTSFFYVEVSDGTCPTRSRTAKVSILTCDPATLSITTQPKNTSTPAGGSASFTVVASGSSPDYQWYQGLSGSTDIPVVGATSATLNVASVPVRTSYWVRVSNNEGACTVDSSTATVEICTPPIITVPPQSQWGSIPSGENSVPLTTSVSASGNSLRYVWYEVTKNLANERIETQVPGAAGPTFTMDFPTGSTPRSFFVKVYDDAAVSGCVGPTQSGDFSMSLVECIKLIGSPNEYVAYPGGANFMLSVLVEEGPGKGPFHYKWYHGVNGQSAPLNVPEAANVIAGVFGDYDAFWCVITTDACPGVSVTTPKAYGRAWNACPLPPVTVVPPRVTAAIGSGVTPTFRAFVDWPRVSYQWYFGQSGDTRNPIPGATQSTVTPGQVVTTMYWVRVTNECGTQHEDSATVVYSVGSCDGVFINAQPQSVSIAAGGTAALHTDASSDMPLTYAWFEQGETEVKANGTTYTVHPTVTTTYYAKISNECVTAETLPVTVHVKSCDAINIAAQPMSTFVRSDAPTERVLFVTATPASGTLSYQWYVGESGDTSNEMNDETFSSLHVTPTQTTSYWVRITSTSGCAVDSDTAVITWCVPPHFPTPILGGSIRQGGFWLLDATAAGTNLTYKWRIGSSTGAVVSTDPEYWVSPPDTTTYVLEVNSGCDPAAKTFSAPVVVTVCTTPAITQQPQNKLVFPGKTAQLHVSASEANQIPITYQWQDAATGTTVGTNSPDFTTPPITEEKRYMVHLQRGVCGVDSEEVTVSFCTLPEVIGSGVTLNVAPQQNVTLHLPFTATSGNNYAWYHGPVGNTSDRVGVNSYDYSFFAATSGEYWAAVTNPDGCVSRSTPYIVNVCVPSITQQPASIMLSPPATSVPLSVTASPATAYQWYIGEKGDITTPVSGGTTATINVSPTSSTRYWVRVTGSCGVDERGAPIGPVDSESALVTVCQPPAITQTTPGPWIARGSSFGIGVTASGSNLTYQWYTGASGDTTAAISGATSANYTASPQNTTNYWVRVTGSCGSINSATMTISVCMTPVINTHPQNVSIFSSSTATLSVAATEGTTTPMSYQWYRGASGDASFPVGTNSATFTTPALTSDTSYWVRVSCGTCTPADSQTATVSMCPYAQTIAAPPNAQAAIGQVTRLTGASVASGNSYRWYRGASGDLSTPVTSWQSVNYVDVNPTVTTQYWYQLQNGACTSSSGTVTVSVCVPTITTQPASVMINPGASTTLSVVANTSGLTYQWYTGTSGTITSPIGGATGASVTVTPSAATNYWVRVTSSCGRTADSVTAAVTICQPPAITQTTPGPWIARGSSFGIGVTASGTNLAYQWYTGTSGNTSSPISGATGSNYIAGPQNTTSYWVRVTGTCGSVNSATITVSVCATPGITAQPQNVSIFSGSTATLSVTATQATTSPMSYQWYRGASGDISVPVGTNTATYTTPALTANTNYWIRVSCGTCAPADSQTATVSICPYPQIVTSSGDVQTTVGQLTRLSTVSGGGNSYAWYRGAAGDTSNPLAVGSPNNYLDVAPTVTTQYWAQVTTGTCVSRTNTITVSVCVPQITQQPQSVTIAAGASTTLVSAANTAGVTYRWYIGTSGNTASPITGATNPSLTVSPSATTSYWVRATSTCARTADSATATVTICSPPVITSQPVNVASYAGGYNVSVSVQATGSNLTYLWYIGESGDTSTPVGNRDGATGGTTNTLTYSPITITTRVWARITGQCGSVNSNAAWVSVIPTIGGQPQSQVVSSGSTATATVNASANGSVLHYRWLNAANGTVIAGSGDSSKLVLLAVTSPITVYCEVTSGHVKVYSASAEITLCNGPSVTTSWVPNGSCRFISAQINGEYSQIEWYRGQPGDTSTYWSGVTAFNFCPTAPTTFWCRVYGTDPGTSTACNADSGPVTVSP